MNQREWSRSRFWLCHFLHNRHERVRIGWDAPIPRAPLGLGCAPSAARWMRRALGGRMPEARRRLIAAAAAGLPEDPAFVQCLRLLVKEEHYHAQLGARALRRLGAPEVRPSWGRRLWQHVRHPLGLRFELSIMLLSDLVDLNLYQRVQRSIADPALGAMCAQIIRDKQAHAAFHTERLTLEYADFNFLRRNLRRVRLRLMFALVALGALAMHQGLIRASGTGGRRFLQDCGVDFAATLERMVPYRRDTLLAALLNQRKNPYSKPFGGNG